MPTIVNINKFPDGHEPYGHLSWLDEYDIEKIPAETRVVFYWYVSSDYSGYGYMLFRKHFEHGWHLHDMGHCSCYGPTSEMDEACYWDSLNKLEFESTPELHGEIYDLLHAAREWEQHNEGSA